METTRRDFMVGLFLLLLWGHVFVYGQAVLLDADSPDRVEDMSNLTLVGGTLGIGLRR